MDETHFTAADHLKHVGPFSGDGANRIDAPAGSAIRSILKLHSHYFFFVNFLDILKTWYKTIYFLPVSFVFVFNPLSLVLSNLAKCAARQESDFPAFFCYIWARIIDRFLRISNFLILLCKPQITWTATQTFWLILFLFFLCPKLNFFHVADANKTIGTIKNVVLKRLSAVKKFLTTVIDNEWLFIYLKKKNTK